MEAVYMDFNATTPLASEVLSAICSSLKDAWGNPSSTHESGRKAKEIIDQSRFSVAQMIGSESKEIIFTSGGTESNNMIIHAAIQYFHSFLKKIESCYNVMQQYDKPHIITTNIEHDSVKLPLEILVKEGKIDVTFLPVSKKTGQVVVDDILNDIRPNTCLISVMLANNETGILQPVALLGSLLKKTNSTRSKSHPPLPSVLFHSDAAQAIGKIPVDVTSLGVDYLTIVGHKFYGPRIGALYFRQKGNPAPLYPVFFGGGQERNYRPGTENTSMIAGLGKAADLVVSNINQYKLHMTHIRDYLEEQLKKTFGDKIIFNNVRSGIERLPNTCSVAFLGENVKGHLILSLATTVFASTGAACHQTIRPSSVLIASGVNADVAAKTLRLSVGRETSEHDVNNVVLDLRKAFNEICDT